MTAPTAAQTTESDIRTHGADFLEGRMTEELVNYAASVNKSEEPSEMSSRNALLKLITFQVIIALLKTFDGASLRRMPLNISLNTLLALLTTATKAAFMLPVVETISQWKWNLYNTSPRGRSLIEFQIIDNASRGIRGSFWALARFKWRNFTSLGAILILTSTALSPITQLAIEYRTRIVASLNDTASVPYVTDWVAVNRTAGILSHIVATKPINDGLSNTADDPIDHIAALCSTANCQFPVYSSLGICSKVSDVSSHLTVTPLLNSTYADWSGGYYWGRQMDNGTTAYNASLPNGANLVTPAAYTILSVMSNSSLAFADEDYTALNHAFILYTNAGNASYPGLNRTSEAPWQFGAVEVMFHLCVNTYETRVVSGKSYTTVIASSSSPSQDSSNIPTYKIDCHWDPAEGYIYCDYDMGEIVEGITLLQAPVDPGSESNGMKFTVTRSEAALASYLLQSAAFVGEIFWDGGRNSQPVWSSAYWQPLVDAVYGENMDIRDKEIQQARLEAYYNSTAISMTNYLRNSTPHSLINIGTPLVEEAYIHIHWPWIVFLATQMVLSCILLILTISSTCRSNTPVLKSDILVAMLALTNEVQVLFGAPQHLFEVKKKAKNVSVKMEDGRIGLY
ncbi:hypothetical protein GQ53DRAFT_823368 [Thozetella sp. PMI_491]|nr:hypothetical protein GQ53DRAFT_823368 [Thozetella sp. PMI_491]